MRNLNKEMAGSFIAVICVGVIAVAGIFMPSQITTIENKTTDNKTWYYNAQKSLFGTGAIDTNLQIDSEIWLAYWTAFTQSDNGQFYIWIYGKDNMLTLRDAWYNKVSGLGVGSGSHVVVGRGTFRVSIIPTEIDDWAIWIYEYR